jgi:hypothetical protein
MSTTKPGPDSGKSLPAYEKLGAFYLGRPAVDGATAAEPLLYDSADLTTHAVIIGMTGSGKTGLGIGLIEEAAIDRIPVIAIDPKGDLGNLLLSFPDLAPGDFEPWVDPREAANAGLSTADFARQQAELWRQGLKDWDQDPDRIARLREAVDLALYTPGSTAGLPLSVLGSLAAPPAELREDADLYRQHVQGVAGGLLLLAGIEADPVSSREHILVSTVLDQAWQQGQDLDLAGLIGRIQQPGVTRVGVLDLDTFYPPKDRMALALRLNNLVAAPGFAAWTRGEPLSAGRLLHTPAGRPRVSVISIAHLGDTERMFLVTLLLNDLIAWMRSQPGTGSLRAILYMDEVFGYLPPVANPPSKTLLLTLLKQARAYGLGVVLSTQNPVDLDYKALSNAGTWFIGRLQTEQDRNRVRDGLLSAAAGSGLDAGDLDRVLSGLGKREFLLHNVHEKAPVVFRTRWALSYLRGPLTRDDIRRLTASAAAPAADARPAAATPPPPAAAPATAGTGGLATHRPVLPPDVPAVFVEPLRMPRSGERLVYQPRLLALARVAYLSERHGVNLQQELALALSPEAGPATGHVDWREAEELGITGAALEREPEPDSVFGEWPGAGKLGASLKTWQSALQRHLRTDRPLTLLRSPALKVTSVPGETEGDFRIRLQQLAREERDRKTAALRQKYAGRVAALEERLRKARQGVEREQEQASAARMSAVAGVLNAGLGLLLGRRKASVSTASRIGTAARQASRVGQQSADVERARENVASLEAQLQELNGKAEAEIAALEAAYDAQAEALEEIPVRPRAGDITVQFFGLAWLPFVEEESGLLVPAFRERAGRD